MRVSVAVSLCLAGCSFRAGKAASDGAMGDGNSGGEGSADALVVDAPPRFIDRGLLVRYFMDEAASGQAPAALVDAAPSPLNLPITYTSNLSYAGARYHRGLASATAGDDGRADIALAGTKLATNLTGATTWTLEVVYQVKAVSPPSGVDCRILTIATGTVGYGNAALVTSDTGHVDLEINGIGTAWPVDETSVVVLHAVVDTSAASSVQRTQVFVNGGAVLNGGGTEPAQNAGLNIAATDHLTVGNVSVGGRSFVGDVLYAAIYDVAFTPAEVGKNASALMSSDDSQPQ
jgi:hypothetical protein